ncbi:Testis-expressed sequence 13B protein [Microtus ochrogaster]|uniref:Testis-expressed sequence 13B protein n=1 Tax=Microtus ochrogaster TaxID=79684 RepID=A0A8J6GX99_MICOH|nr:Testis-expressed sequence 13B protein [Microtus ochrogaster]
MAVEFGDHNSGFHHTEVIRFINNEVLMNGGSPEFYMTFRSRSWNEIEDHLHTILVDPKVPRSLKRACTWSALALSVRVGARQREQQARRVGRLQEQVGERETASWTLASELQRLREERDQAAAQLVSTQTALQEAMDEREILRGRLLQAERSALPYVPEPKTQQGSASVWSLEEEWRSREAQTMPSLEAQMPVPPVSSYLPGLPGPWVQSVQPFLQMPVPHPLPLNTRIPLPFPYSTPVPCPLVMESGATTAAMATVVPQIAPAAIYPPGMWVSMGSREATASACGQTFHRHSEYPENLQDVSHLGNSVSHCEEGSKKPQGTPSHGDSSNNNHKESHVTSQMKVATEKKNPVKDQVTTALEVNSNHSIKEEQVMLQGMTSQKNETSCTKKNYPGNPKKVVGLKDSVSHSTKEDSVTLQETVTQVNKTSPTLKKYPGILLKRPDLRSCVSSEQKEDPKTSQGKAALGEDNTNTFQQMTTLTTDASPSLEKDEGTGKSQGQKEEPNSFQASPLRKSKSYSMNKCPSKQLPPKQNIKQPQEVKPFEYMQPQGVRVFESIQPQRVQAFESMQPQRVMAFDSTQPQGVTAFEFKQAQGEKSFETKQQEKPLSYTPANWVCSLCKAVNRSWCKGCFKCAKGCAQLERKDFHPKPPY